MDPTGFYWIGARYYEPVAGRFLSPDPAGFEGSTWDLYSYCGNDPINNFDPTGRFAKTGSVDRLRDNLGDLNIQYGDTVTKTLEDIDLAGASILVPELAGGLLEDVFGAEAGGELLADEGDVGMLEAGGESGPMNYFTESGQGEFGFARELDSALPAEAKTAINLPAAGESMEIASAERSAISGLAEGQGEFDFGASASPSSSPSGTGAQAVERGDLVYGKYQVQQFEGRRVYTQDIEIGEPSMVDESKVNEFVAARLKNGASNLDLMREGLAPIGDDGLQINLHHVIGEEPGPMVELESSIHSQYQGPLHGLIEDGRGFRNTPGLESQYNQFRKRYWQWRASQYMN